MASQVPTDMLEEALKDMQKPEGNIDSGSPKQSPVGLVKKVRQAISGVTLSTIETGWILLTGSNLLMVFIDLISYFVQQQGKKPYMLSLSFKIFNVVLSVGFLIPIFLELDAAANPAPLFFFSMLMVLLALLQIMIISFDKKTLFDRRNKVTVTGLTSTLAVSVISLGVTGFCWINPKWRERVIVKYEDVAPEGRTTKGLNIDEDDDDLPDLPPE